MPLSSIAISARWPGRGVGAIMSATSWSYPAPRFGCRIPSAFIRIESRVLAAVAEVKEVGHGIIEEGVRIRLDLEVLNQPEGFALENPQMAIEAGHIQFVEVTAQEERVLSVVESGETLGHLPACQVHNFEGIVCSGRHKQALLFQSDAHVIEAAFDSRQRNRLHQPERLFFLGGARDGQTGQDGGEAHCKKLRHFAAATVKARSSAFCAPR